MTPVASRLDVDRISDRNIDGEDEPRTAFDLLRRSAERWPGRAALHFLAEPARIERARTLTFEDLFEQVCAAATLFQAHGIETTDVVAVALSNRPEAHIAIWGAQSVATVMPINGGMPTSDFAALLALATPEYSSPMRAAGRIARMTSRRPARDSRTCFSSAKRRRTRTPISTCRTSISR